MTTTGLSRNESPNATAVPWHAALGGLGGKLGGVVAFDSHHQPPSALFSGRN